MAEKKNRTQTTSKKQKFVRSKGYIDPETGEVVPFQEVQVEDRDFNFHKVWLEHFLSSLDGISNQKMRLAFWIIENLNSENQLVMTQDRIAEAAKMSTATVKRTMKALQESEPPFLVKINSGAYQVLVHTKSILMSSGKEHTKTEWAFVLPITREYQNPTKKLLKKKLKR